MSEIVRPLAECAAAAVEMIGILVIAVVAIYAFVGVFNRETSDDVFHKVRLRLGRLTPDIFASLVGQ